MCGGGWLLVVLDPSSSVFTRHLTMDEVDTVPVDLVELPLRDVGVQDSFNAVVPLQFQVHRSFASVEYVSKGFLGHAAASAGNKLEILIRKAPHHVKRGQQR